MKPKTLLQKRVVELSKQLPKVENLKNWAISKCHDKFFTTSHKKQHYCLDCGHKWSDDFGQTLSKGKTTCPKCNTKLKHAENDKGWVEQGLYLAVITKIEDFQVIRIFWSEKDCKKLKKYSHWTSEVMQHFIDSKGRCTTLAKKCYGMSMYFDNWTFYSDLEIRSNSRRTEMRYNIKPHFVFPKKQVQSFVKRNGFKNGFHNLNPKLAIQSILSDSKLETLYKANQFELFNYYYIKNHISIDKYWNSLKIIMRNNYKISDVNIWHDYMQLLEYFGKDLRNAKYVCPTNLKYEHDKYVKKKKEKLRKEKFLEMQAKIQDDNIEYQKHITNFNNLSFKNYNIVVEPIKTVSDVYLEGDLMEHCVFVNEYHRKKHVLLMSAKIGNERIETIAVSLKTFEVLQSRGKNNHKTPHHTKIVDLVNNNMNKIQRAYTKAS